MTWLSNIISAFVHTHLPPNPLSVSTCAGLGVRQDHRQALCTSSRQAEAAGPLEGLRGADPPLKGPGLVPTRHTGGPFKTSRGGEESYGTKRARRLKLAGRLGPSAPAV